MIDWNDLRHFLAVAREGTLSRAATRVRLNPTTVGRRLTALEEEVGARLFDRTPEGYVLTGAGRDLLPRAERMEVEALALEREIQGADQKDSGLVRVTATEMLATRFIAPRLPEFHRQHPGITLDLHCTHRIVSLGRREADVALRLSRPKEENVVTKRLAAIHLSLYASPAYLEEYGVPKNPDVSLGGHCLVMFADSRSFRLENDWFLPRLEGAEIVMRSDSVSSIYAACVAGLGLAMLPRGVADADSDLVKLPTQTTPEPRVIWQTVHEDLMKSARIRAVLDFLTFLNTSRESYE
jgi:DNA-binding transcriptional LysR family regulator